MSYVLEIAAKQSDGPELADLDQHPWSAAQHSSNWECRLNIKLALNGQRQLGQRVKKSLALNIDLRKLGAHCDLCKPIRLIRRALNEFYRLQNQLHYGLAITRAYSNYHKTDSLGLARWAAAKNECPVCDPPKYPFELLKRSMVQTNPLRKCVVSHFSTLIHHVR
jgi:hypothetical protein